ncbi:MAG: hypothetical protein A3G75_10295 [Verrucomicrobia bacterium RIFCSPLOWO2_12_FULL_64_8]|nr:MAG: hypothetical protein A3G75_10295 [Verrucomicrobia bacterium RIFCSPLOWO2_12_FULL_64_8]
MILWPVLLAGTISVCSGFGVVDVGLHWMSIDKVAHFLVYGLLATAVARIPGLARWPFLNLRWAILMASAYGYGDEIRQSLTHVRTFEISDWMADTAGAMVAVPLYAGWGRYRRLLEMPVRRKRPPPPPDSRQPRIDLSPESLPNPPA